VIALLNFNLFILSIESRVIPSDVRQSYIDAVGSIQPCDPKEAEEIQAALRWLRTTPALTKPDNLDQHLGVLSVLVSLERDRTFLLDHRKAKLWLPPGGHVDFGRRLDETAREELQEELGIQFPRAVHPTPVFLNRTLTQGLNAGHIDLTAWFIFEESPEADFLLQEKEATCGAWIEIKKVLAEPQYINLHRGFNKLLGFLN
jgi:8-oxo-dGTP diphosphatase